MRTRLCRITLAALVLLLLAVVPARADEKPEDLYFSGFQAWKKGEALLKEGKRDEARPKLKEAEETLAKVQTQFPNWNPEVVNYRLTNIRAKLAELTPAPVNPPPQSATPPPPPVHIVPDAKTPYMPMIKPAADYLDRPKVPFIFNGEIYYKMLLSPEKAQPASPATKASP